MDLRCIHCGFRIKSLIVQYSPENLRLIKCENCRAIADEYIECEIMILLIDLILHEPKAYRHVLYNAFSQPIADSKGLLWWSTFGYIFMDAYRVYILPHNGKECNLTPSISSLAWIHQKILGHALFGNLIFFTIFLYGSKILLSKSDGAFRYKGLFLTILISSYLKIILIAIMVWEFPLSVIFTIDIFVLSSNTVALKVLSDLPANKCMMISLFAHVAKFFTGRVFDMLLEHL